MAATGFPGVSMRKLAVFAALTSMIAAPPAPAQAADTPDIYSRNGITGPSFSRSTQCAAVYVLTVQLIGAAGDGYTAALKQGTAWLAWAGEVAEGQDAAAEMNRRKAAFTQRTASLNNDDYNAEISKELQACVTVRETFAKVEPFGSQFAKAVAQSGNSAAANTPDVKAAIDCAANFAVVRGLLGEEDENYAYYNKGMESWYNYAVALAGQATADQVVNDRVAGLNDTYSKLLNRDQAAGLTRIDADAQRCTALAQTIPDYF